MCIKLLLSISYSQVGVVRLLVSNGGGTCCSSCLLNKLVSSHLLQLRNSSFQANKVDIDSVAVTDSEGRSGLLIGSSYLRRCVVVVVHFA